MSLKAGTLVVDLEGKSGLESSLTLLMPGGADLKNDDCATLSLSPATAEIRSDEAIRGSRDFVSRGRERREVLPADQSGRVYR